MSVVYGAVIPTLPKLVGDRLDLDPALTGVLFSFYALGLFITTPVTGYLSDKYQNRKLPMLFGLCGLVPATILFGAGKSFTALALARMGQGVSGGITWSIGFCMLADVYPPERLGSVMSKAFVMNTVGLLGEYAEKQWFSNGDYLIPFFCYLAEHSVDTNHALPFSRRTLILEKVGPVVGGVVFDYLGAAAPFKLCFLLALVDLMGRLCIIPSIGKLSYDPILPIEEEVDTRDEESAVDAEEEIDGATIDYDGRDDIGPVLRAHAVVVEEDVLEGDEEEKGLIDGSVKGERKRKARFMDLVTDPHVLCTFVSIIVGAGMFSGQCLSRF
ncbi:hypothetical protein HK102_007182 [Quaeritorhiza haematococci]|nr:hypothetical protein HK102_007182 [Quaeritorhiza haematococci]